LPWSGGKAMDRAESTLHDRIGGGRVVRAAVDRFYDKVLTDPSLSSFFADTEIARLKRHQRAFFTAALGGPRAYQGKGMADAHAEFSITKRDFDAVVGHLAASLFELRVPIETICQIGERLASLETDIVTADEHVS
jgi:hemoglobin